MPRRRLTFLVIPEEGGGTYEYKIPRIYLWLGMAACAGLLVLLGIGGHAYVRAGQLADQVDALRRDRDILSQEVELIEELEDMLRDLEASNRQLRSITAEAVGLDTRTPHQRAGRLSPKVIGVSDRLQFGTLRSVPTLPPVPAVGWRAFGRGVLFPAPRGSLVVAAAAGQVERTGYDRRQGYTVVIDHRNGVRSTYGGLGWLTVEDGGFVQKGQPLGLTGWPGDGSTPGVRFVVTEGGREITESLSDLWL